MTPHSIRSVSRTRRLRAAFAALVSALALGVPLLAVALCVVSCKPNLPPVSNCAPYSHRCEGDNPQVCSHSRRWHTWGDQPCAASGGRCAVVSIDGKDIAVCAPMDGGALPVTSATDAEVSDAEVSE